MAIIALFRWRNVLDDNDMSIFQRVFSLGELSSDHIINLKFMNRKSIEKLMSDKERRCFRNVDQLTVPVYFEVVVTDT